MSGCVLEATGLLRDGLLLVQEMCTLCRVLRPETRAMVQSALHSLQPSLFSLLEKVVKDPTMSVKLVTVCVDIFMTCMLLEPWRLRQYVVQQRPPLPPASILTAPHGGGGGAGASSTGGGDSTSVSVGDVDVLTLSPRSRYAIRRRDRTATADGAHRGLIAVHADSPLLQWLIWRLVEDAHSGVQSLSCDLLRLFLEVETQQVRSVG